MADRPEVSIHGFQRRGAITLSAGGMAATFLPEEGMVGASLQVDGREHLSLEGGLSSLGKGRTAGMPLLHPWANRLSSREYTVGSRSVDLRGLDLPVDGAGLPIHGTMLGSFGWEPVQVFTTLAGATAVARYRYGPDHPLFGAFPFPHEITTEVTVDGSLSIMTSVSAAGEQVVPIAFGYHPWFRLPGARRSSLRLVLPARQHAVLDGRGIPTGEASFEPAEAVSLRGRSFDDHYVRGERGRVVLESPHTRLVVDLVEGYPYFQIYAPEGRNVVCIEPMTARVDALVAGTCVMVAPGDRYRAHFTISVADA